MLYFYSMLVEQTVGNVNLEVIESGNKAHGGNAPLFFVLFPGMGN